MEFSRPDQEAANDAAANDPKPGDYWHEMYAMVLLVVRRSGSVVWYVDEVSSAGANKWTFKEDQEVKFLHKDDLKKRLSYGSIPGYWADVRRSACSAHVQHFSEAVDAAA